MKRLLPLVLAGVMLAAAGCSLVSNTPAAAVPEAVITPAAKDEPAITQAPAAANMPISADAPAAAEEPATIDAPASLPEEKKEESASQDSSTFLSYRNIVITVYEKGEPVSVTALSETPDVQAVQDIVFHHLLQSAAWQGVDVSALDRYTEIAFDWTANAVRQAYYQYDIDGSHVLQMGEGMYTCMSEGDYETLLSLIDASQQ